MSPIVQAKFLRVLQEREFQRLGGSKTLTAGCRVIAATNRDPKAAMEKGTFREDLYYRLSVFEISLPPLRDRRDDILLLVENFLSDLAKNIGRPAGGLSEDAKDRLIAYHWPGNVRELRNAIERAVILAEGGLITSDHLPIAVGQSKPAPARYRSTLLGAGRRWRTKATKRQRCLAGSSSSTSNVICSTRRWLRPRTTNRRPRSCSACPAGSSTGY